MLTFETAREEDIERLFALEKELIDTYEDRESIDYDKVLDWVRRKLEKQVGQFTRVLRDEVLVGYYHLTPGEGKWELDDLFIFPEYRGQGIGAKVLERCFAQAEGPIFLYVFVKNDGAVRLYERMGFRVTQKVEQTRYIMERFGPEEA